MQLNLINPQNCSLFLGKGGSGKTTSAIFAAQHYAMQGLKTCLVIQSQDPTAEYLLIRLEYLLSNATTTFLRLDWKLLNRWSEKN